MLRKLFDSPWLYFVLAAALVVVGVVSQFEQVAQDAPSGSVEDIQSLRERDDLNVVFIVIDTLRADRLHVYGYERETSPSIDALASRGIRFAHVEAQSSWTKASMASLWTAMYPQRTGVLRFPHALPPEAVLPAEIFKEAGYRTGGVFRNGWVANNFGFDQGFDLYVRPSRNRPVQNIQRHNPSTHQLVGTDLDTTESGMEFILNSAGDRFFLYVHYMDVHQYLYADTSPEYGSSFSDIYDSAIHWTDRNVGALVDALGSQGLLDQTLIVIASDHGEAFFEHGGEGHARNLYGEVQEVPLVIVPPFGLSPGLVIEERVANVDIWPTVLDLVGLPPLPQAEGRSLVPLILAAGGLGEPPAELQGRALFAQLDRNWGRMNQDPDPLISIVQDDFRMLHQPRRTNRTELYDKSVDPTEQKNVAAARTDVASDLAQELSDFLEVRNEAWAAPEVEIDAMKEAQLRALGYVMTATDRREAEKREEQAKRMPKAKKWGE